MPAAGAGPQAITCQAITTAMGSQADGYTYAISTPGQYILAGNCVTPAANQAIVAITITASNVDLKLNGYTITQCNPLSCNDQTAIAAYGISHLHIEGPGTISGFCNSGIAFGYPTQTPVNDSHVEKVTLNGPSTCDSTGMRVLGSHDQFNNNIVTGAHVAGFSQGTGSDNHYSNNVAENVGQGDGFDIGGTNNHIEHNQANNNLVGIRLESSTGSANNEVNDNTANGNHNSGIDVASTGNHIHGNTAMGNGQGPGPDLLDENGNCVSNHWDGNHFHYASPSCIH